MATEEPARAIALCNALIDLVNVEAQEAQLSGEIRSPQQHRDAAVCVATIMSGLTHGIGSVLIAYRIPPEVFASRVALVVDELRKAAAGGKL
jgi:hypothetical protein